jgi:hypothetical protein
MGSMSGERTCSNCGASMQAAQDWCLKCGAPAAGGSQMGLGWRAVGLLLAATLVLVLGAAAAAYAALQQSSPAAPPARLAQTPSTTPATTTTQTTTAPPASTPTTTPAPNASTPGSAGQSNFLRSLKTSSRPPKVPSTTPTPAAGSKAGTANSNTTSTTTTTSSTSDSTSSTTGQQQGTSQPVAVLLDTNAAQIYNPDDLPASRFGDPSLAIDGDSTTAWTVQLQPNEAPAVGVGLSLDLNAALKIAQLTLITESVGITVQVYGTSASKLPAALDSEEWVRLSKAHVVKKRKATITLSEDKKPIRQLLIWILKAPTSSSGQFTASEVAIDEVQLYEPK